MKSVIKVFKFVANVFTAVSIAALVVMIGITIVDVIMRNFFKAPVTGAVEITRMMMVCMSPAFMAALFEGRHVNVGLIVDRFSRPVQLVFDVFGYLLTCAVSGIMCYQGIIEVGRKMAQHQVYTMLKIPTWPFYLVFSVSMGFFAIAIIVKLIDNILDKTVYAQPESDAGEIAEEGGV